MSGVACSWEALLLFAWQRRYLTEVRRRRGDKAGQEASNRVDDLACGAGMNDVDCEVVTSHQSAVLWMRGSRWVLMHEAKRIVQESSGQADKDFSKKKIEADEGNGGKLELIT